MARIRNRPEQELQIQVCRFLDVALPEDAVYFAIPNGFKRTKVEAGVAKITGQKAGVSDLCIIHRSRPIFIELKAPKGRLSEAQAHMQASLMLAGALVQTCRSLEDVEGFLSMVMELRGRLTA